MRQKNYVKKFTVMLSIAEHEELRRVSYLVHSPMSVMVRRSILKYLEKLGKHPFPGKTAEPYI